MRIAITSRGADLSAAVDDRFGRAPKLVLYDTETREVASFDNEINLSAAQGAGIQTAQAVSGMGAQCLITGHCGPKAFRTLAAAGVRVYTGAHGSVADAIRDFELGRLTQAAVADVEGHW